MIYLIYLFGLSFINVFISSLFSFSEAVSVDSTAILCQVLLQEMASSNEVCKEACMTDKDMSREMPSNEYNPVCADANIIYNETSRLMLSNDRNAGLKDKDTCNEQLNTTVKEQTEDEMQEWPSSPNTIRVKEERDADSIEEGVTYSPTSIAALNSEPEGNGGWSFNVLHVESHDLQVVAREGFDAEEMVPNIGQRDGTQMQPIKEVNGQDVVQRQDETATAFCQQEGTQMHPTTEVTTGVCEQDVTHAQCSKATVTTFSNQTFNSIRMHPSKEIATSIYIQDKTPKQCTEEIPAIIRHQNGTQIQGGSSTATPAEEVHAEASTAEKANKPGTSHYASSERVFVSTGNFQVQDHIMQPVVTPHVGNKQEVAVQCQFPSQMPIPTDAKPFQCPTCLKTFAYKWSLKGHERIHSGYKPYKCKHCEKAFTKQDFLDKHERIHTGLKPFVCKYCERAFTQESNLTVHERIHTGVKPYNCKHCNKAFAQRSSLKTHERIHTGVKPYQCSFCNKLFAHQGNLKEHERIHTGFKPYQCSYCNKAFTARSNLDLHKRIHTGYKPHKCAHCEKTFLRQGNLEAHERTHTGVKPFKCKHCDKAFAQQGNLEKHERIHTGIRPYSCKLCNKEFSQQSHLKVHERLHTGEKPYKCRHCGMAFTFSGMCKKHELKHNVVISTETA